MIARFVLPTDQTFVGEIYQLDVMLNGTAPSNGLGQNDIIEDLICFAASLLHSLPPNVTKGVHHVLLPRDLTTISSYVLKPLLRRYGIVCGCYCGFETPFMIALLTLLGQLGQERGHNSNVSSIVSSTNVNTKLLVCSSVEKFGGLGTISENGDRDGFAVSYINNGCNC